MTKLHYLAGLMLAAMSCTTAPKTTITLHMEGNRAAEIPTKVSTLDSTYTVALDSTHSATIHLADNQQAGYASIRLGRMQLPLYIEPGKSFDVSIKIEGRKVTPTFTGEGAAKNTYLNGDVARIDMPSFGADEKTFLADLEKAENEAIAKLGKENFDETFVKQEKRRIHYKLYSGVSFYPLYHPYYGKDQNYQTSEEFYNTVKNAVLEEPELIDMPEYQASLTGCIEMLADKEMPSRNAVETLKKQLEFIKNNYKSPAIADFTVDHFISKYVGRYGVDNLSDFSAAYNANVTDPQKKAAFKALCDKWAKVAKGQPSIGFTYKDINGKEVSLKDLAGKYVYIDCWATWCGPCQGELPHLQELEHKYAGKNIHFVSISCDQDKAAWEKMVKERKLGGIQLHNGGDNAFMDFYMISGIPRFILLDREGKILQSNATRPSNPETVKTFDALEGL